MEIEPEKRYNKILVNKYKELKESIFEPSILSFGKSIESEMESLIDKYRIDSEELANEYGELEDLQAKDKKGITILELELSRITNLKKLFNENHG